MTKPAVPLWPGRPYPLGATWDGEGVNFSLFSERAEGVELCLFDGAGRHETGRVRLTEQTDQIWHGYAPQARPGQLYGYRVHGPYKPKEGLRFNANKLLLDPYAKGLAGELNWSDAHFGYRVGSAREDLAFDRRNNAADMPKSRVIDPAFDWGDDRAPRTSWQDTIIYELHVRGFTRTHPDIAEAQRGTYAALGSPPVIDYLSRLGVTAVELMPVHAFVHDRHLLEKGLRNYWGYNSIGFFAPHVGYAGSQPEREFKSMVKALHAAGLEVILDVVYNHTAEGNQLGPTLSFRGIDNASYYRLVGDDPRYYMDFTGCGNTLNMMHPRVLQLIMDSLRYWILEMHVDGFRFDLAATLARELHAVDRLGAFFDIITQDPVISQVKLIAEPWDLGEGGYQVGRFPLGWTEWNGKYRDAVRSYWKGDGGLIGEVAYRLSGSSDLYNHSGRKPHASINFIACHDGFTLHDLVSYNDKHNDANLEDNRDGANDNLSWNCGAEGPTDDAAIIALRERQKRNFLATLLLSQGVPMLSMGDEAGRTQQGNNNAYCQDNELSWMNWKFDGRQQSLLEYARQLIQLRLSHRIFRRRNFFQGRPIRGERVLDILWLDPSGTQMSDEQWGEGFARCLGMFLSGRAFEQRDMHGNPVTDSDFLLLLNAHHEPVPFTLPEEPAGARWHLRLDTHVAEQTKEAAPLNPGAVFEVQGRALVLFENP